VGVLEVTAIDVGQGDSILVAFPDQRLAVVDGGGIPSWGRKSPSKLDIGEDVVSSYLWTRSIRQIDLLVLTHAHEDHSGGLAALIDNYSPKELWIASAEQPLLDKARERGVKVRRVRTGERLGFGGAWIDVLAPGDGPIRPNDDSVVLKIQFGQRSFLLTGDIERRGEAGLVDAYDDLRADVLKVAHHGSRTSSNQPFLDSARPSFAIISAGADNTYRHPHEEVLARLEQRGVAVLRTDRHGLISVRTDGRQLWVDTQAWGDDAHRLYAPF
jgi:competence protein ComEC